MTLDELVNETLAQKNRRQRQEKCRHDEIYSSTVAGPLGIFKNTFCLECGQQLYPADGQSPPPSPQA